MNSSWKTLFFSLVCLSVACKTAQPMPDTDRAEGPRKLESPAPQETVAGLPDTLPFHLEVTEGTKVLPKGLHSFSLGRANGQWLFIGGRTNGFHRTSSASRTFPTAYANTDVIVYELATGRSWSRPLPAAFLARLSATNAQSFQDGGTLYVVGGYGSNCGKDDPSCYGTFSSLTAIQVQDAINAVIAGDDAKLAASMVSIEDPFLQVTGGMLRKVGQDFYLVFGHNYQGIYKDARVGAYTEQVRRFQINFTGGKLTIANTQAFGDPSGAKGTESQFHRRDLNVTEAITPSGAVGLSVWGGVFTAEDGGWDRPIHIEPQDSGAPVITVDTFQQKTNYYECANLLMYDPGARVMYTTLFGGITNYWYDASGQLQPSTRSNWLPFTNIISTLGRASNGTREYIQPANQGLPHLMGANSEFVLAPGVATHPNTHDIVDLSKLTGSRVLVGYIVGGIRATAAQTQGTNPTYPNEKIYEVYLVRP